MSSIGLLRPRHRRVLALAAGGLVLAAGASVTTLAAWQDNEYVWGGTGDTNSGGFTSTAFNVQQNTGPVDGAGFADRESAPGGQLDFTASAGSLTPGDTVYAFVQLRTATGSSGGTLALSGATATPANALASALEYGARSSADRAGCDAAGYATNGSVLVPEGTPLATGSGSTTFALAPATASAPGPAVGVCFAVTLPDGTDRSASGQTVRPTWHFDATSG